MNPDNRASVWRADVRERDRPAVAEVAVTVLDAYQRRGLGTLLVRLLAPIAASNGVATFVYYMRWDNDQAIEQLRVEGAWGSAR